MPKPITKSSSPTGIKRTDRGWRAFVRVHPGPGGLKSKCFPPGTSLTLMKRWREDQRVATRHQLPLDEAGETLSAAVRRYLPQVQTMPTYGERCKHLMHWLQVFGQNRIRRTITSGEIRTELERMRAAGVAANTVNHYRTALAHLWTVLDGKTAPNPARDVPKYRDESLDLPPRALSQPAVTLLLDAMPDSLTRARLVLFAWTGFPPAQMARLEPNDIEWDVSVRVKPRRKGRGAKAVYLPLLPQAWTALRAFKAAGAWGEYSTSSARMSFRRAARKARRRLALAYTQCPHSERAALRALRRELLDVTPYQLRHSFLTLVAGISKDDRAVQTLGQHADIRTSHRYTERTADPRAADALQQVTRWLQNP